MKRSKHSLTHYKLLTGKMGMLIPISWFEALPGDTIQMSSSCLVRAAPMVTPAMHPCHIRVHHFFVPNRIIWAGTGNNDGWEDFITGGFDGNNATSHPTVSLGSVTHSLGSLADYLGVPATVVAAAQNVNALPFRAYTMIWNEFYRDQDLQTALALSQASGSDTTTNTTLQNCDWEKDYLTSSRPWEIKGPSVTVPIGGTAPITGLGVNSSYSAAAQSNVIETNAAGTTNYTAGFATSPGAIIKAQTTGAAAAGTNTPQIFANLAGATGVTINTLRHALAIQRFEEARARYGSRYTEYLRYLGVRSSDARLQRPEYLGGGRSTLQISEVLQTAVDTSGTPNVGVAKMFGHGISAMRSNRFRRFFEEHGIVMSLLSVRPRTMYSSRMERAWYRGVALSTMQGGKEDYWQRELQHIGQQKLNNFEVDVANSETDGVFGYQDRYDEYRRKESSVSGLFRSTLDTWHLSREFGSAPALNASFVSCVPSTRIFADTSNDNLYVMAHHSIQARRLVAREGTSLTF